MRGSLHGGAAPLACLALLLPAHSLAQDADAPAPAPVDEPVETEESAVEAEDDAPAPAAAPEAETPAPEAAPAPEPVADDAHDHHHDPEEGHVVAFDPALAATPQAPGAKEKPHQPVPWLTPNAQIQTWFTAWDQDEDVQADPGGYGDPEHDLGFNIPRARLGMSGGWKVVDFAVRFGTTRPYDAVSNDPSTSVQLVDAWARVSAPSKGGVTRFMVGQIPIAYSRESMMSSNDLVFQERAVSTNWLAPVRDLGAALSHNWKWIGVTAGVYNGGGSLFGDDDPGVQFVGRLDITAGGDGFRTNDERDTIAFGVGYLYNKRLTTQEQRVNVDLLGRIKGITLLIEGGMGFVSPDEDPTVLPPDVPETTRRLGGMAQLSYYKETKIGAIEPAVRFSYFDDATHLKDNGDVGILHAGLNWREPLPFVDVGAAYIHREEFQGRSTQNDSVRVFFGLRYPSRRFKPLDLVGLFRKAGTKPLAAPASEG